MTVIDEVRRRIDAIGAAAPVVVAIDGRSGAGKSTLARSIAGPLGAALVEADGFYRDMDEEVRWSLTPAEGVARYFDWQRLLAEALVPLRERRAAVFRPFDWATGSGLAEATIRVAPVEVVLVEGVYSARAELRDVVDICVLLVADEEVRRRRLADRGHGNEHWHPRWEAAEDEYFTRLCPPASFDLIVADDHPFPKEPTR